MVLSVDRKRVRQLCEWSTMREVCSAKQLQLDPKTRQVFYSL